jgi:hypothetical protein
MLLTILFPLTSMQKIKLFAMERILPAPRIGGESFASIFHEVKFQPIPG